MPPSAAAHVRTPAPPPPPKPRAFVNPAFPPSSSSSSAASSSPPWPHAPDLPSLHPRDDEHDMPSPKIPPLPDVSMSSLSPSSNPSRVSDASTNGPPLPSPRNFSLEPSQMDQPPHHHLHLHHHQPPPPPPHPSQQPPSQHLAYPEPGMGNSPFPSVSAHHYPNARPDLNQRFERLHALPHYSAPNRLTMTEPTHQHFPSYYHQHQLPQPKTPPQLPDQPQQHQQPHFQHQHPHQLHHHHHLPPSVSHDEVVTVRGSAAPPLPPGPSRPISSDEEHNANSSNSSVPDGYDHAAFTQSRSSEMDNLMSSAEPTSIHAGASTHIDITKLKYDFDNKSTRIGQGTYGTVYMGSYFDADVAIKRIRIPSASPNLASDQFIARRQQEAISQFAREIRRYERVSHPGIVRFYGVTLKLDDPAALLVTEFMKGGSLADNMQYLRTTKIQFEVSSIVRIAMHACGGLRALHDQHCTWGDGKPENILLTDPLTDGVFPQSAVARIADFGLSRSAGQTLLGETTIGQSGQPAGSFRYMSPEYFSLSDRDAPELAKASDIYSFGMVMYEMLTMRVPWKRRSPSEVVQDLRDGKRPEWPVEGDADYHGPIKQELRDIVENCWRKNPKKRPTAEQVFSALNHTMDVNEQADQRPLSVLADGVANGSVDAGGSMGSTVVPFVASVELGSQALESTTESRRTRDVPNEFDESDEAETAPVNNPAVSPVTSPEPRSGNRVNQRDPDQQRPHPHLVHQQNVGHRSDMLNTEESIGNESQAAAVKHMPGHQRLYGQNGSLQPQMAQNGILMESQEGLTNSMFGGANGADAQHNIPQHIPVNGSNGSAHNSGASHVLFANGVPGSSVNFDLSSAEFRKYGKGFDSDDDNEEALESWANSVTNNTAPSSQQTMERLGHAIVGSNISGGSSRKMKAYNAHSMLEQALMVISEQRRQKQSKLTPKQRKEATEKRAEEEARNNSERESLSVIDEAKDKGNYSIVLKEMKSHRQSQSVIKAGMNVIEKFCEDESLFFDVCEEGGVEELVSGAALHGASDVHIAICFCQSVRKLSDHCNDKVGHIIRAVGVPSVVIEMLNTHKTNVDAQRVGCESLAIIAQSSELSRSAVATLGGPAAVYMAMTKNNASFMDPDLGRSALKAVRYIAQDNEIAAEFLVQVSALDSVSRAAEVFTDHGLEEDILEALRAFSFYDGGRRNVIMSSGIKALTSIMVRNTEPDFLVKCCTFIRAIARWRDHECEAAMLASCISSRITSLMKSSNDIPGEDGAKVAWYSSHACTFLASFGSRSRQRLRGVGAIETAIEILRTRKDNARVVHSATDALAELLKGEEESKRHAERCNVIEALNEALAIHHNVVRVRKALEWTLNYLSAPPRYDSQVYQQLLNPNRQAEDHITMQPVDRPDNQGRRWFNLRRRR